MKNMSQLQQYRQCRLIKKTMTGEVQTTSYLPEKFAVVGRVVELKNRQGDFEKGWTVVSAGELTAKSDLDINHNIGKKLWKATSGPAPRGNK